MVVVMVLFPHSLTHSLTTLSWADAGLRIYQLTISPSLPPLLSLTAPHALHCTARTALHMPWTMAQGWLAAAKNADVPAVQWFRLSARLFCCLMRCQKAQVCRACRRATLSTIPFAPWPACPLSPITSSPLLHPLPFSNPNLPPNLDTPVRRPSLHASIHATRPFFLD